MQSAPYPLLEDEPCPVPDETLGEMYRASARGLSELDRARSHLQREHCSQFTATVEPHLSVDWVDDRGKLREGRS